MGFFQITLLVIVVLVGLMSYPIFTIGCLLIGLGYETGNMIWSQIGVGVIFLLIFINVWKFVNNSGKNKTVSTPEKSKFQEKIDKLQEERKQNN